MPLSLNPNQNRETHEEKKEITKFWSNDTFIRSIALNNDKEFLFRQGSSGIEVSPTILDRFLFIR